VSTHLKSHPCNTHWWDVFREISACKLFCRWKKTMHVSHLQESKTSRLRVNLGEKVLRPPDEASFPFDIIRLKRGGNPNVSDLPWVSEHVLGGTILRSDNNTHAATAFVRVASKEGKKGHDGTLPPSVAKKTFCRRGITCPKRPQGGPTPLEKVAIRPTDGMSGRYVDAAAPKAHSISLTRNREAMGRAGGERSSTSRPNHDDRLHGPSGTRLKAGSKGSTFARRGYGPAPKAKRTNTQA